LLVFTANALEQRVQIKSIDSVSSSFTSNPSSLQNGQNVPLIFAGISFYRHFCILASFFVASLLQDLGSSIFSFQPYTYLFYNCDKHSHLLGFGNHMSRYKYSRSTKTTQLHYLFCCLVNFYIRLC